jgi:D-aminoacyl-tRNA deacylase
VTITICPNSLDCVSILSMPTSICNAAYSDIDVRCARILSKGVFASGPFDAISVPSIGAMRCVVQRVSQAFVTGGGATASIGPGMCVLVGIGKDDTQESAASMVQQILSLKAFHDESSEKRWTQSLRDIESPEVMLVPQFTLHSVLKSGRPSFHRSMPPSAAKEYFARFVDTCRKVLPGALIVTGFFGSMMNVQLINEGTSATSTPYYLLFHGILKGANIFITPSSRPNDVSLNG